MKAGIVAFAFGAPDTLPSNRYIGEIACQKAVELGAPVFTQLDVPTTEMVYRHPIREVLGRPPSTFQISLGAMEWSLEHELDVIYIAAAPPHIFRVQKDIVHAMAEKRHKVEVRFLDEIFAKAAQIEWFCQHSTQPWTRTPEAWQRRERQIGWIPRWLYKHVAVR